MQTVLGFQVNDVDAQLLTDRARIWKPPGVGEDAVGHLTGKFVKAYDNVPAYREEGPRMQFAGVDMLGRSETQERGITYQLPPSINDIDVGWYIIDITSPANSAGRVFICVGPSQLVPSMPGGEPGLCRIEVELARTWPSEVI